MKSIVFDFDGTLIDSSPGILLSIQAAIDFYHLPSVSLSSDLIGPPIRVVFATLYPDLCDDTLSALVSSFQSFYDGHHFSLCNPYPNAYEALSLLRNRNIRLFLVTNKREKPTFALLKALDWEDLFDHVLCLDMLGCPSSNKSDVLSLLISMFSLNPVSTPYLGDRHDDYLAANVNSMPFLFAQWGYGSLVDFSIDEQFKCLSKLSLLPSLFCFK